MWTYIRVCCVCVCVCVCVETVSIIQDSMQLQDEASRGCAESYVNIC